MSVSPTTSSFIEIILSILLFFSEFLNERLNEQMHYSAGGICSPKSRWDYSEHMSRAEDGRLENSSGLTTPFGATAVRLSL